MPTREHAIALLLLASTCLHGCAGRNAGAESDERPERTVLSTVYDDARVGERADADLSAQIGLYDDPALVDYVAEVGRRMVQHTARRPFEYRFQIVDQAAPNAFALPGGFVYVSRGLLALVSDEHELANVIAHEITHASHRHAAAQQEMARRQNPLQMPILRMAKLAAYGRAQENDADRGGQQTAAAAGYDPAAMPHFLQRLGDLERLRGDSRLPSYLDTHPGTTERVSTTTLYATQLEATTRLRSEPDREGYLRRVDGITFGPNPAEGVFRGDRFLHPKLGFQMRFPPGWVTRNDHQAVGASSPDGNAVVFLRAEGPAGDPQAFAAAFVAKHQSRFQLEIVRNTPIQIGGIAAWRVAARGRVNGRRLLGQLTFVPHDGLMYRITAVAPERIANDYVAQARNAARSFHPLPAAARSGFEVMRLRFTRARSGESIPALIQRTDSALRPGAIALINGVFANHRFTGGEWVKFVALEPYPAGS